MQGQRVSTSVVSPASVSKEDACLIEWFSTTLFSCPCLSVKISNHGPEAAEGWTHAFVTPVCVYNESFEVVEEKRVGFCGK